MTHIEAFNEEKAYVLGKEPYLFPHAIINGSNFGAFTEIRNFAHISNSSLDDYSYVCEYTQVDNAIIGKFANIASHVRINPGFHPLEMPCQHHFLYRCELYGLGSNDESFFSYRKRQKVHIGHDVWIGHGAVIMPGVRIGNGAVIGSNAVVTKDVPAYAVVAGVASKILKYRFSQEIIDCLQKMAWWDWEHDVLKQRLKDFNNIREFVYKYGN
jgi:phosphonate metabolism protein (transferase hexapeptide repeat family)